VAALSSAFAGQVRVRELGALGRAGGPRGIEVYRTASSSLAFSSIDGAGATACPEAAH
jgi:hypothetical protein